jgi:hypothetical protein
LKVHLLKWFIKRLMELAELELEVPVVTPLFCRVSRAAKVAVALEAAPDKAPEVADLAAAVVVVAAAPPIPALAGLVAAAVEEQGLAAKVAVAVAQMAAQAAQAL